MNTATLQALREMAGNVRRPYPFTLAFTREFTRGTLAGLTHDDTIGFCTAADCDEWVSAINRANAAGRVDYKVTKFAVIAK